MKKTTAFILYFSVFVTIKLSPQQTFCLNNGIQNDMKSIVQTNDGGYALGGSCETFTNLIDFHVIKTDAAGNLLWARTAGGSSYDQCHSITKSSDNGIVMCGYTNSFGAGLADIYVVKFDSAGNLSWTRTVGGTDSDVGHSIISTLDGGYIVSGYTKSYGAGMEDAYVVKLDAAGTVQWTSVVGGALDDNDLSTSRIVQTADSGYTIAGSTASFNGTGSYDMYIIRLNPNGSLAWTKTIGGAGTDVDEAIALVKTSDGGYAVGGRSISFAPNEFYIVKLDMNGNVMWGKGLGGSVNESTYDLIKTSDEGFAVVGRSNSFNGGAYYDILLIKLDQTGNIQWSRAIGDNLNPDVWEEPASLIQTLDGGYGIVGSMRDFAFAAPIPGSSCYFVKLDANGNGCCTKAEPTPTLSSGGALAQTGGVQTSGGISNTGGTSAIYGSLQNLCITTGLFASHDSQNIGVYPNPFSHQTVLKSSILLNNAKLEISNSCGQLVKKIENISGESLVISNHNLANGFYTIRLIQDNRLIAIKKVMVDN